MPFLHGKPRPVGGELPDQYTTTNPGFGPGFYRLHFARTFKAFLSFSVCRIRVIFPFAGLP